jgi:uncharacterized lipoprotein YmbA
MNGSSTLIMDKIVQAGGPSAPTPLSLGLAALVPPGEGLLRHVFIDNRRPCRLPGYPLQTSKKLMNLRFLPILALVGVLFSGCLSPREDHTRFYLLSAPPSQSAGVVESDKVFLVGMRVTSVEYLRTKQMLVELGSNQLTLSEAHVWQETPQAGFARILSRRFAEKLPDCQLTALPSANTNAPELMLEVELHSMQGRLKPASEAEVSAEVRILDAKSRLLERDELRKTSPWGPMAESDDYPALAAAESRAAAELADAIAEKVLECHRKMSGR